MATDRTLVAVLSRILGASLLVSCSTAPPEPAPPEAEWELLLEGEWQMPAGTEGYRCVYGTLTEEVLVSAIEPIAPAGTHHVILSVDDQYDGADGVFPCTPATLGTGTIYGSGVGTEPLDLPEGTGLRLAAGTRLVLNLHLLNAGNQPISGTSGVRYRAADAGSLEHPLDLDLAGKTVFSIPPNGEHTETSSCSFEVPFTIVGLFPHMHQLGTHEKVVLVHADGSPDTILHDATYSFEQQEYLLLDPPAALDERDTLTVTCTWNNTTDETVKFGTSSNSEMCFAGLLRWPEGAPRGVCQ